MKTKGKREGRRLKPGEKGRKRRRRKERCGSGGGENQ